MRTFAFAVISVFLGLLLALAMAEAAFRFLEYRGSSQASYIGRGGLWVPDGRWGWKPDAGPYRITTHEFKAEGTVNPLNMNDPPFEPAEDRARTRIFVLGDSHTYATGVSLVETWPRVLEHKLRLLHGPNGFRIYNGAVTGFNMHQYLLRLMDQGPVLKPHYVAVGLSYATDLYDLLPPGRGGWIYGGPWARDYFDFDSAGQLVEQRWEPSAPQQGSAPASAQSIRRVLDNFATFRYLRRSKLALFIGSQLRVGGESLWPNMEVVVVKDVSPIHEYQWRLFEALLLRLNQEAQRQNAKLIIVGIPYIAQVYDELWSSTFGMSSKFDRTAGIERVRELCRKHGITYVDTLDALRNRAHDTGRWVHYRDDAHPTPEGHEIIADTVVKADVLRPVH